MHILKRKNKINNISDQITKLRRAVISILDDANGISAKAHEDLIFLAVSIDGRCCDDIWKATESNHDETRYWLPEDHGIIA